MFEGNNIAHEEEYHQARAVGVGEKVKVTWRKSKSILGALRDAVCPRRFFVSNVRDYELSSTNCVA